MRPFRFALAKFRALFRHDAVTDDIREEMRFHLAMREDELRLRGVPEAAAKVAASRRFGNLTVMEDRAYAVRGGGVMDTWFQDLRYAGRLIVRQPRFSALVILTIALATGVSTALFSVADVTILRPLPFPHPEQLVRASVQIEFDGRKVFTTPAISDVRRWRATGVLTNAALSRGGQSTATLDGPVPEQATVQDVTEAYLSVHGGVPAAGREFLIGDTGAGAPPVVMVSFGFWQRRLGGDPSAIGKILRHDNIASEIIGVMPAEFYPNVTLWRPLRQEVAQFDRRGSGGIVARLRPGISLDEAARQLTGVTPVGTRQSTISEDGRLGAPVQVFSLRDDAVAGYATTVRMLAGAVGVIVLIACVNVAGLLLARGAAREAELAVRASIGASRRRLIRQLLIESATLASLGGALGALFAWLSLDALLAILPISLKAGSVATINLRVLAAAGALSMVSGLAFGLVPALRLSSRADVNGVLASGARRSGAALSKRGGQLLIAVEVALAFVLVAGAGLMLRSFERLTSVDLGFDPDAVVAFKAAPVDVDPAVRAQDYPALLATIRQIPGVRSAGVVDHFALGDSSTIRGIFVNGTSGVAAVRQMLPGYFEALGLRAKEGRFPDTSPGAVPAPVAVVNETAARTLYGGAALGGTLGIDNTTLQVVAVVQDFRHPSLTFPRDGGELSNVGPEVFIQYDPVRTRFGQQVLTVVVRPDVVSANLNEALERAVESIGPRVVVEDPRPGAAWFADQVATPRHRTTLLGLLGGFGLLLSLVGVFSMTAFAVARRTREIGVRMALGARPIDVVRRVVRDAAWPTMIGLAVGLVGVYFATRVVQSLLFETTPHDAVTFTIVTLFTLATALLAAWIPARRAARIDPVAALRAE